MLILFGVRSRARTVGHVTMQCPICGVTCAQALREGRRWFTLFFIPIVPVSHTYALVCSSCGQGRKLDKPQAEQMKVYLAGHAIGAAGGGGGAGTPPAPPGGMPPAAWNPPAMPPPPPGAGAAEGARPAPTPGDAWPAPPPDPGGAAGAWPAPTGPPPDAGA
ncbi:MAG: zinc-ribbon domain-containing protein [Acidimicrobiales bacterium]